MLLLLPYICAYMYWYAQDMPNVSVILSVIMCSDFSLFDFFEGEGL